jgi:hypothetical protein
MDKNKRLLLEYIDEVSHKLNDQDSITNKITDAVYNSLLYNNRNGEKISVDISEFGAYTNEVYITVYTDGKLTNSYGRTNNFNPLEIEIHVSQFWDVINPDKLKYDIRKTIAHELMHGNIFTKKYNKVKDFSHDQIVNALNDYPDYYEDVVRIKSAAEPESLSYYFAYALYTSYYHEVQAFVAQTDSYFKKVLWLNRNKNITNVDLKNILKNCEEYEIFVQNISTVEHIRNMSTNEQKLFLQEFNSMISKGNEIYFEQLNKLLTKIETVSNHALKNIEDVLMYDYDER